MGSIGRFLQSLDWRREPAYTRLQSFGMIVARVLSRGFSPEGRILPPLRGRKWGGFCRVRDFLACGFFGKPHPTHLD